MTNLLTIIAYETIDAFLCQTETSERTAQRRMLDDAHYQRALDAEEKRRVIATNLAHGKATKRRFDEAETNIDSIKRRRVFDHNSGLLETRPAAQEHIRTARNHRMFCIKENAFLIREDGSDYVNPKAQTRPSSEDDLLSDKLEGLKLVYFVYHGSNANVAAIMIKEYIPDESKTRKDMMGRLKAERARLQHRLFTKARAICKELTESEDFAEIHDLESKKLDRIQFFKGKATKDRISDFYSHVASAVNLSLILASNKAEYTVIRRFMKTVFIKTMEGIWYYELHPDKKSAISPVFKANQKELFESFRNLTDAQDGLPVIKELPSYLDVPVTPDFPRRHQVLAKRTRRDNDFSLYTDIDSSMPNHDDVL